MQRRSALYLSAGRLELIGFAAEATALGAGLRRLGVTPHFIRRGEYKTAPELFTDDQVSEIQKKTLNGILDEGYASLLDSIVAGRKITPEEAKLRIDEGPYSAKRALAKGLVDGLIGQNDLETVLAAEGEKKARIAGFATYAGTFPFPPNWAKPLRRPVRLAVVPLSGMISHGKGGSVPFAPKLAGSEPIAKALRAAARDRRCPAVLLYIDSPEGSALGSELILEEVKRTAAKKPVIAFFDRVAASGGYMAALGANEMWSSPQAIVGSIGVFAGKFDASDLLHRIGIHRTLLARGENAAIYSSSRGFTPHERTALEADIDETYETFLEMVASARKRTRAEIHARAEGRIFSGKRALEEGLVDRLGLFEDACKRALELSGKASDRFEIAMFSPPVSRLSVLSTRSAFTQASHSPKSGSTAFAPRSTAIRFRRLKACSFPSEKEKRRASSRKATRSRLPQLNDFARFAKFQRLGHAEEQHAKRHQHRHEVAFGVTAVGVLV